MARNSELILCSGIRLDREYSNVIDYSESDMLSLCRTNKIAGDSNYSFIRNDKRLVTSIPYSAALQGNYIAFQNPDYSQSRQVHSITPSQPSLEPENRSHV